MTDAVRPLFEKVQQVRHISTFLETTLKDNPAALRELSELVQIASDGTANVNQEVDGQPLVMHAARTGDVECMKMLKGAGANLTCHVMMMNPDHTLPRMMLDYFPLAMAAFFNHFDMVQYLLSLGSVNQISRDGYTTALISACAGGHGGIVDYLLQNGADVHLQRDQYTKTAMHVAAERGHADILALLMRHGGKTNTIGTDNNTVLTLACSANHFSAAKVIMDNMGGLDINAQTAQGQSALRLACAHGNIQMVHLLLASPKIDVNLVDHPHSTILRTPLFSALETNNYLVIQALLKDPRIDVNIPRGWTPLHEAISRKNTPVAKALLRHPTINLQEESDGETALHTALDREFPTIVKQMLEASDRVPEAQQLDFAARNDNGDTALYMAAEAGFLEAVKLLLPRSEAVLNVFCWRDYTALCIAVLNGHECIVRLLLEHPAIQIDHRQDLNPTPLALGILGGRIAIVRLLLAWGATALMDSVARIEEDEVTLPDQLGNHQALVKWLEPRQSMSAFEHAALLGARSIIRARLKRGTLIPDALSVEEQLNIVAVSSGSMRIFVKTVIAGFSAPKIAFRLHHAGFQNMVVLMLRVGQRLCMLSNTDNALPNLPPEIWRYMLVFALRRHHTV